MVQVKWLHHTDESPLKLLSFTKGGAYPGVAIHPQCISRGWQSVYCGCKRSFYFYLHAWLALPNGTSERGYKKGLDLDQATLGRADFHFQFQSDYQLSCMSITSLPGYLEKPKSNFSLQKHFSFAKILRMSHCRSLNSTRNHHLREFNVCIKLSLQSTIFSLPFFFQIHI